MRSLRILLVEDDASIVDLLAEVLEDLGHVVCAIERTEAGAVRSAIVHAPELMIVDEVLGAGSGVAAMAAIARIAPVPHIFMTGARSRHERGDDIVLYKPFIISDLVAAIGRASGVVPQAGF